MSTTRMNTDLRSRAWLFVGALGSLIMACSSGTKHSGVNPMTGVSGAGVGVAATAGNTPSVAAGGAGSAAGVSGAAGRAAGTGGAGASGSGGAGASGSGGAGTSSGAGGVGASGASGSGAGSGGMPAGAGGDGPAAGSGGMAAAAGSGGMPATCDKIPPSSMNCMQPLAPGDARKCEISVGLNRRSYYLYAPPTYDPCKPTALVLDCHGAMETAEAQAGIDTLHVAQTSNGDLEYPGIGSGWRLEADTPEGGFIVVTPQGISNVWTSLNNDPQFFLDIVAATKKIANIAADKVYMSGISNGSLISYETVCAHTDVFSGIAAHSAGQNCSSIGKPIPVISFDAEPDFAYSTTVDANDTMVRLDQCKGAVNSKWLTIDSNTTDAVCRNDPFDTHPKLVPCNTITKTSITASGIEPTVCKRWEQCNGGVAVVFCDVAPSTLHGSENAAVDAHILYGNATSLNTPSVAWRFFKSFWK
jgi:poly(3-hydroxybutyrate) depolymerase